MVDEPRLELLTFPTDYPIKVLVRTENRMRLRIDAIVSSHAPDIDLDAVIERASENGNFASMTYTVRAQSAEHITALVKELTSTPNVIMVI